MRCDSTRIKSGSKTKQDMFNCVNNSCIYREAESQTQADGVFFFYFKMEYCYQRGYLTQLAGDIKYRANVDMNNENQLD